VVAFFYACGGVSRGCAWVEEAEVAGRVETRRDETYIHLCRGSRQQSVIWVQGRFVYSWVSARALLAFECF